MQDAYLVAYNRSAVTKAKKGGFRFMRSDDLAVMIIQGLLAKVPEVSGRSEEHTSELQSR